MVSNQAVGLPFRILMSRDLSSLRMKKAQKRTKIRTLKHCGSFALT